MSNPHLSSLRQWPYRPDFNQFKRQAKELLKAYRAGDASAVAEVERHEQAPDQAAFALHDAQRVLARSYGFASWQKLKSYVQTIQPYWRPLEIKSDDDTSKFVRLACITYFDADHPSRRDRARQIFAEKPHLAKATLYTSAAVGDVAAVADFLTTAPMCKRKAGRSIGSPCCTRRIRDSTARPQGTRRWKSRGYCSQQAPTRTRASCGRGATCFTTADRSARPGRRRLRSRRWALVAAAA